MKKQRKHHCREKRGSCRQQEQLPIIHDRFGNAVDEMLRRPPALHLRPDKVGDKWPETKDQEIEQPLALVRASFGK